MLAMSPSCPATLGLGLGLGWEYEYEYEYPIELGTNNNNNNNNHIFDNLDFDSMFVANIDSSWNQTHQQDLYHQSQQSNDDDDDGNIINKQQQQQHSSESRSRQGTSSTDDHHNDNDNGNPMLAKKLNHNASERDRRRKINSMYSSLRALLPANHHRKKLSIPATVGRVLEYIPELQKEVDDLIHKKQVILSKVSALQPGSSNADAAGFLLGGGQGLFIQDQEKLVKNNLMKMKKKTTSTSCSISANRLGEKEMVIQISAFQRISMAEVLLMLENNGFLVIDVSSFQSFGGTTFYILHLWMEGRYGVDDYEKLNEMLMSILQNQNQNHNHNHNQIMQ